MMRTPEWWADELRQRLWRQLPMPLQAAEAIEAEGLAVIRECLSALLADAERQSNRAGGPQAWLDAVELIRSAQGEKPS